MFTTKKATSFVLAEGPREVYVEEIGEAVNKNGKPYIGVVFRIRKDVDQPNIGASARLNIYQAKDPTPDDRAMGGYQANRIYQLAECAAIPEGSNFATLDELFEAILGAPMMITIKNRVHDGQTYADVYVDAPSQRPLPPELQAEINRLKLERRVAAQERANRAPQAPIPQAPAQAYSGQYQSNAYTPPAYQAPAQGRPSGAQAFVGGDERVPF